MTDEQYLLAKSHYEKEFPGEKFENLRLYQANEYLAKLAKLGIKEDKEVCKECGGESGFHFHFCFNS